MKISPWKSAWLALVLVALTGCVTLGPPTPPSPAVLQAQRDVGLGVRVEDQSAATRGYVIDSLARQGLMVNPTSSYVLTVQQRRGFVTGDPWCHGVFAGRDPWCRDFGLYRGGFGYPRGWGYRDPWNRGGWGDTSDIVRWTLRNPQGEIVWARTVQAYDRAEAHKELGRLLVKFYWG